MLCWEEGAHKYPPHIKCDTQGTIARFQMTLIQFLIRNKLDIEINQSQSSVSCQNDTPSCSIDMPMLKTGQPWLIYKQTIVIKVSTLRID